MENINKWINKIHQGDTLDLLKQMPSAFVDTVITSPPYWGLRDYGVDGQIGLEDHPSKYINHLVEISREIKRVLKKTGSFFLNLGDTYYSSIRETGRHDTNDETSTNFGGWSNWDGGITRIGKIERSNWLQPKQLLLIPSRVAISLQDDGWILRNDIIWYKRNSMPSSVKDRLNVTHEHIFHFCKAKKYYYDLDAVRIPHKTPESKQPRIIKNTLIRYDSRQDNTHKLKSSRNKQVKNILGMRQAPEPNEPNAFHQCGKNPGSVWDIPTYPFSDAHFAVFPPEIVEIPIKASCPQWICKKCGKPRERILKKTGRVQQHWAPGTDVKTEQAKGKHGETSTLVTGYKFDYKTAGWTDCGCNDGWTSGIVLDPFVGSGTACLVAKQLGCRYIGIDLNPEYVKMAKKRLNKSVAVRDLLDEPISNERMEDKWKI